MSGVKEPFQDVQHSSYVPFELIARYKPYITFARLGSDLIKYVMTHIHHSARWYWSIK